ncbi:MAG: hypothetical protein HY047_07945 [Acidobacteria bacterium]|nr:hypothetical protein [Acidobacteriota bacterium]
MLGTAGGYVTSEEFLTFVRNAETGVTARWLFEGRGPLAILIIVFLGGLAQRLVQRGGESEGRLARLSGRWSRRRRA